MQNNQNNTETVNTLELAAPEPKIESKLCLFTQPEILQQIDPRRINKLLRWFADDFTAAGITLPDHELLNGEYHSAVGRLLAGHLPDPVRTTLIAIESAASPENAAHLDAMIKQHIPNVGINSDFPLDCALEVWLHAPAELDQFKPALSEGEFPLTQPSPSGRGNPSFEVQMASPARTSKFDIQNSSSPDAKGLPLLGERAGVRGNRSSDINPPIHQSNNPSFPRTPLFHLPSSDQWPEAVDGKVLLDALVAVLRRFVVLPIWAAEALALWIVHTFAFQLRDVSAYIGIESPEKRCGKTTLLTLVSQLVNRPVVASNISPPAFFRVIEELRPTLLIDEADTFLRGNDELRGILNSGNKRETAFVVRVSNQSPAPSPAHPLHEGPRIAERSTLVGQQTGGGLGKPLGWGRGNSSGCQPSTLNSPTINRPSQLATFSSWCPKALATIDRLPDTLADRCIVIRMQRKTSQESCERLRNLDAEPLRRKCARFVADHSAAIAAAHPPMPAGLNDRATDIWEPLVAVADLAGGNWPERARQAAVSLSASAQENSPIASLLVDIFLVFVITGEKQLFTKTLVQGLVGRSLDRPWTALCKGREINPYWLGHQLRPYGIKLRNIWIGNQQAKGYAEEDFHDILRRYVPRSELDTILAEFKQPDVPGQKDATAEPLPENSATQQPSEPSSGSLAA